VGISQAQRSVPSGHLVSETAARLAVTYVEAATLDSWLADGVHYTAAAYEIRKRLLREAVRGGRG